MTNFARQWIATLTRATPAYWWVQGLCALVSVVIGIMMLERIKGAVGVPFGGFVTRALLDALLFFLVSHVGLRPMLRLRYIHRTPTLLAWLGLLLWLLLMAGVSLLLGLAIDHLKLTSINTITAISFRAGEDEMAFDLQGGTLYFFVILNLWITYITWAALYLGWQAMQQRRKLLQQVQQARLAQLTHQLNPHFLFNAFNTIRGTIFENPQRAADLITELSELFRFHLSQSERSTQTLEEEWRLAQRYLAIEQARLEQRLRVKVDLAPECMHQPVPSLALLGLIENAIKHGIAPSAAGGELAIRARARGPQWLLEVCNDVGPNGAGDGNGTGTGLANLRERLELGFSDQAQMEIDKVDGQHRVRLLLPWVASA
jgi:heme exporter protein D